MKTKLSSLQIALATAVLVTSNITFAVPISNSNEITSFAATNTDLGSIATGALPGAITTVISNVNGYLAVEQGINATAIATVATDQTNVNNQNTTIANQTTLINNLIAANPLDPTIPAQQAVLAGMQAALIPLNTTLSTDQAAKTNSVIKIALYQSAINGPVTTAQAAAAAAAQTFTNAQLQFAAGANKASANYAVTGTPGLQGVADAINGVSAGNQAPVTLALTTADATFSGIGAAAATVTDIQNLVNAINTNLPLLPAISTAQQTQALQDVLNGSYERAAINTLATTGIPGVVSVQPNGIHIGPNSLVTSQSGDIAGVGGQQNLFATDVNNAAIDLHINSGSNLVVETNATVLGSTTTNGIVNTGDISTGTLHTTGLATLNSASVTNGLTVGGATNLNGGLTVTGGNTSLTTLSTSGLATLNSASVTNNLAVGGNATVTGTTTLTGALTANGGATVNGNTRLNGNLAVTGSSVFASRPTVSVATAAAPAVTVVAGTAPGSVAVNGAAAVAAVTAITGTNVALVSDVSTEATSRAVADNQLQTNINAETTRALSAEQGLRNSIDRNTRGIAMVAALQTPVVSAGKTQAVNFGVATFDGQTGLAGGYAYRINQSLQVNISASSTSDFKESVVRGGVNYEW